MHYAAGRLFRPGGGSQKRGATMSQESRIRPTGVAGGGVTSYRLRQFHALAQLFQEINREKSLHLIFAVATEGVRAIIGAKWAVVKISVNDVWARGGTSLARSGEQADTCVFASRPSGDSIDTPASATRDTTQMMQAQLGRDFQRQLGPGACAETRARSSAWLEVPLLGRDGGNIGSLRVADKHADEFTAEDEAVLALLAQFLSLAVENARLTQSEEDERAKLENETEERKRLENDLRQAQKMAVVGQLAGGIAHDFNNILTASLGYSELMIKRLDPRNQLYPMAKCIRQVSLQARELTRRLLAFSRQHVLEPQVLSLNEIVSDVANMFQELIGDDILLVRDLDPRLRNVRANPSEMEQAFLNLVVNACDAMAFGGTMTIRTSNMELPDSFFRDGETHTPGGWSVLEVSDTGCGMDEETMSHIFAPFFTTKDVDRGSGLGLTMIDATVKQSGGIIRVESEVGVGTTFRMYLPQTNEQISAGSSQLTTTLPCRGVETILVVEDDRNVRKFLCESLASHGYTILSAAGGLEALRMVKSNAQRIDLLLTDLAMSEMDGRMLADQFNQLHANSRVLFISGHPERLDRLKAGHEFPHSWLAKPFTPDALATTVREILDRKIA